MAEYIEREALSEYFREKFEYYKAESEIKVCGGYMYDEKMQYAAIVAKHCDGAILVIAQGMANSRMIASVKKQLEASGVNILGAILNKVSMKKAGYYGRYYGGYYGNYYGNYHNEIAEEE